MSLLASRFRESVSKLKDYRMKNETEFSVGYPTGFLSYDFTNGAIIHVKSQDKDLQYYSIGITDGSMVMVIGRSGCGKTTWVMQSAGNIVKPFKSSCIWHDDIEGGITESRKEQLVGLRGSDFKAKYISRNTGITAENFYERVKMIYDLKTTERAEYEYDTGLYDTSGNRIYKLEPSVYILDSLALLMPEKYTDEDELSGQMSSTAAAKANAMVFKRIIPMLKSANIILFVINHILDDVSINPMQKKKPQFSYLKMNETLPGGKTPGYLCNNMIRFDDHDKLSSDKEFGIDGIMVDLTLVKSRTNRAGQAITLIFDYSNGFDQELSLFLMLKENGKVNGAGAYLYLGERNDFKFAQKNIKEKLRTNPEFREIFNQEVYNCLKEIIEKNRTYEEQEENNYTSVTDSILQLAMTA